MGYFFAISLSSLFLFHFFFCFNHFTSYFFDVMISKKKFLDTVGFRIFFLIFWHPLSYTFFIIIFFLFVFFVLGFYYYFLRLKIFKRTPMFILNDKFNPLIIQNNKKINFFKFNKNIRYYIFIIFFFICYFSLKSC